MNRRVAGAGQITDKSDVYAFGVVVLEMMTGMQAVDARRPTGCEALPQLLQPALQAVQLMQVCCTALDFVQQSFWSSADPVLGM